MKKSVILFIALVLFGIANASFATQVALDFTNWTTRIITSGVSDWRVESGGTKVKQYMNGESSAFLSTDSYINKIFRGTARVEETGGDDDFWGIIIGCQDPTAEIENDMYLLDWKQATQVRGTATAWAGIGLAKLHGEVDYIVDLWGRPAGSEDSAYYQMIGKYNSNPANNSAQSWNVWGDTGWVDNRAYSFEIVYQQNRLAISIDGNLLLDLSGNFAAGKFGFYTYSQMNASFYNFTIEDAPIPEPATILLLGLGGLPFLRKN